MQIANPGAAFTQGFNFAGQIREQKRQNALADLFKTKGAEIAAGNPEALNAFAQLDPMAARGIRREDAADARAAEVHGMRRESHTQGMQVGQAQLESIRQQAKNAMEQHTANMSAAEAAAQWRKLSGVIAGAAAAYRQGPAALESYKQSVSHLLQEANMDPSQITYENAPEVLASLVGANESLEAAAKLTERLGGPNPDYKVIDGQYIDQNNPAAGAQPVPGFKSAPDVPLVDFSGANFGPQPDTRPIADKPPKGFQRRYDPSLGSWVDEPIPGSEQANDRTDAMTKEARKNEQARLKLGTSLTSLSLNIAEVENGGLSVTGPIGEARRTWLGRALTGNEAMDVQTRTNQITDSAAFAEIQNMRDNSPTGGAVGQLTDKEREAIGIAVTALTTASSDQEYLRAAKAYRKLALDLAYGEGKWQLDPEGNPVPAQRSTQPSKSVSEPPTITSDADYDALPSGTVFIAPDGSRRRKP